MSKKMILQATIDDPPPFSVHFSPKKTSNELSESIREAVKKAKEELRERGVEVIQIGGKEERRRREGGEKEERRRE